MKRNAREIEGSPNANAVAHQTGRPAPTYILDNTNYDEIGVYMHTKFNAQKYAALGKSFYNFDEATHVLPVRVDRLQNPEKPKLYDGSVVGPILPDDAIAAILKETQPDCPKAQAWNKAHEISKATKERIKAKQAEKEELRIKIIRKSIHLTQINISPPSTNLQAVHGNQQENNESKLTPKAKVQRAHDRLQKALMEVALED